MKSISNRLKALFLEQLRQGTTPRGLAMALAWGMILGIFPCIGITTIFCALIGSWLRLNQPVLQTVNYLMAFFQLLMMPVWLYIGEAILQQPHLPLNPKTLITDFFADVGLFFQKFGMAGLHAAFAWALIAPLLGVVIYKISLPVFTRLRANLKHD